MSAISVSDLDNAKVDVQHIAAIATSSSLTATDRLGGTKKTIAGWEDFTQSAVATFLSGLGYLPPVAYTAGLVMNSALQTVSFAGVVYAPKLADLPFTSSGTFETAKFRVIQGVLASDLAASGGAAAIGFGSITVQDKLRTLVPSVIEYGAVADGTTANDAAFAACAAASPNGTIYVPRTAAPFKLTVTVPGYDFSKLVGPGKVLWNGLTLDLTLARSPVAENRIESLFARVASGESGLGACAIGDSLTAGQGSSGYTGNPGGVVYGPPNAWPAVASRLVRQILVDLPSSGAWSFRNAGLGGQSLSTGWAILNFQSFVLTPYAGLVQALVIGLGHNDGYGSPSNGAAFFREMRNLIMFARSYGLEPCFITTTPSVRPRNDQIFNEFTSQLDRVVADFGIVAYDPWRHMVSLLNSYTFPQLITSDGVHLTDAGYVAWASCIVREMAARWIIDVSSPGKGEAQLYDGRVRGWTNSGAADAGWPGNSAPYLNAVMTTPISSPGKGPGGRFARAFFWNPGRRKCMLVYRAQVPPENTAPGNGITVQATNVSQKNLSGSVVPYVLNSDVSGWRRGNVRTPIDMPSIVANEMPVGLTWAEIYAGAQNVAAPYSGHLEVVDAGLPAAVDGIVQLNSTPGGLDCRQTSFHKMFFPNLVGGQFFHPTEGVGLQNVVTFMGAGTQINLGVSLQEGHGIIFMGGAHMSLIDGALGRWAYGLIRGGGANNTKMYLYRYDSLNGLVQLTGSPGVSTQNLAASASLFLVLDKDGTGEMRFRLWDGPSSASPALFGLSSVAATAGSSTTAEAPPVSGVAFGAFSLPTTTSALPAVLEWATITRYSGY